MTDDRKRGKLVFGPETEYEREIEVYEPDEATVFALLRSGDMMHEDNEASRRILALQVFGDALEGLLVNEDDVGYLYRGITGRRIPISAYADLAVQIVEHWGKAKAEPVKAGAQRKRPASRR
jgi:hypothetical protein